MKWLIDSYKVNGTNKKSAFGQQNQSSLLHMHTSYICYGHILYAMQICKAYENICMSKQMCSNNSIFKGKA